MACASQTLIEAYTGKVDLWCIGNIGDIGDEGIIGDIGDIKMKNDGTEESGGVGMKRPYSE